MGSRARMTPLKSEPPIRLLIANLVGEEVTREGFASLRGDPKAGSSRSKRFCLIGGRTC